MPAIWLGACQKMSSIPLLSASSIYQETASRNLKISQRYETWLLSVTWNTLTQISQTIHFAASQQMNPLSFTRCRNLNPFDETNVIQLINSFSLTNTQWLRHSAPMLRLSFHVVGYTWTLAFAFFRGNFWISRRTFFLHFNPQWTQCDSWNLKLSLVGWLWNDLSGKERLFLILMRFAMSLRRVNSILMMIESWYRLFRKFNPGAKNCGRWCLKID